jgi:hypothetical protein
VLLKALDLLRTLGWALINFIFSLIDSIFEVLREMNGYNIIDSVADNSMFSNFHAGIIAIALTLLGLFAIWKFVSKIIDTDDSMSSGQIVKEIIKCSALVLLSVFLFSQVSIFSIKLSGYTASIFSSNDTKLSNSMLSMYVIHSDGYKDSDEFKNENVTENIEKGNFTNKKMYNDKYVTSARWILPDEKDYKYSINWIMALIVGGFFLYALFFSGMMLAKRQIEFLFLFIISPIIFATSIGNKQRRSAVIEQLVSLMFQGAVIMLIIGLTAIVMQAVNGTTFFSDSTFKDVLIKSLMFIGCGSFLLTGSQVVNRFIGGNVSANSGREQLMAMMGFGQTMNTIGTASILGGVGGSMVSAGVASSIFGKAGGNKLFDKMGKTISNFGQGISNSALSSSSPKSKIGDVISKFGTTVSSHNPSSIGKNLRSRGADNISNAVGTFSPARNMYRRRYRSRGD